MVYLLLVILVIILDQWSKHQALVFLSSKGSPYALTPRIQLRLAYNPGGFYGVFQTRKKFLFIMVLGALGLCGMLLYLGIKNQAMVSYNLALSMLVGGALGNFMDRIKRGHVVDFIYIRFKRAPIFNLADVFIFIGAIILMCLEIAYGIF